MKNWMGYPGCVKFSSKYIPYWPHEDRKCMRSISRPALETKYIKIMLNDIINSTGQKKSISVSNDTIGINIHQANQK